MKKIAISIFAGTVMSTLVFLSACTNTNTESSVSYNSINNQSKSISKAEDVNVGSLWESDLFSEDRFLLDIKANAATVQEAKKLKRSFEIYMGKSVYFMHHLLTELKKRNLPVELAALPLVESGFNPRAKSHAGAHGTWQFIRSTGRSMGLENDKHYDEFYDFVASTDASLNFLEHLYKECGNNWDLAIAAYNQGEFAVKKAIRRAKANGVKDNELSLNTVKLSAYAYVYVRRFKAYADILRYPEKYGVKRPEIENKEAFTRLQLANHVNSLKKISELSGVDLQTLQHLNAGYLSDKIVNGADRGVLIPVEHAYKLKEALGLEDKNMLTSN